MSQANVETAKLAAVRCQRKTRMRPALARSPW
jgi:hypothetical protein